MQINTGIRSILSISFFYTLYQNIVFPRTKLVNEYIKPEMGQKILDVGCGTGNIFNYLPHTNYLGIDTSLKYINAAKKQFKNAAQFEQVDINTFSIAEKNTFDTVLSIGVLHHIDDQDIINVLNIAKQSLKKGGRFIAVEPCLTEDQSILAKWIISKDRGQNIKNEKNYQSLVQPIFPKTNFHIRHDLLRIPYTLVIIESFA